MKAKVCFDEMLDIQRTLKGAEIDATRLYDAFSFCEKIYEKKYPDHEEYFLRTLHSAKILSEMYLNDDMGIACILQDLAFRKDISLEEIKKHFGTVVAMLVEDLLSVLNVKFTFSTDASQLEAMRRLLVSLSRDVRVVFIKLANDLRDMRNLDTLSKEEQKLIARQVMHISVPLANRLGIWQFKSQLEDLSFKYLHPSEYNVLEKKVQIGLKGTEKYIEQLEKDLRDLFKKHQLKYKEIKGRVKNLYSIYKKMILKKKTLEEINDIFAIRIVVDNLGDCYEALGLVHSLWTPFENRIKDYIAVPKPNGYQSLHTTVRGIEGRPTEIQIRTEKMNEDAEFGLSAHFVYGAKKKAVKPSQHQQEWLEKIKSFQTEMSEDDFSSLALEMFHDRIFVFTPRGDVYELPEGACIIDFAYAVHSDLGNKCVGGKINGKMQSLYSALSNGDTVEVLTSNKAPGPKHEWLTYVSTTKAKTKIRNFLKQLDRDIHLEQGMAAFESELRKIHQKINKQNERKILETFGYTNLEELYVSIGDGTLSSSGIINKVFLMETSEKSEEKEVIHQVLSNKVIIEDDEDLEYAFAKGCKPKVGEYILAYVGMNGSIKIHTLNCPQIKHMDPNRILNAWWQGTKSEKKYPITVKVTSFKNKDVLQKVIQRFTDKNYPVLDIRIARDDLHLYVYVKTKVENYHEMFSIFSAIQKINGVITVERD